MIKKLALIVVMLSLSSGCNLVESDIDLSCETLHNTSTEKVGQSGLVLKPSRDMYLSFDEIEGIYRDLQECAGVTAPGPVVEYTSFDHRGLGGFRGVYMAVHQHALINNDESETFPRDCETDKAAVRHELAHHLVYMSGIGQGHNSRIFTECVFNR